jgi:nitrilase
MKTIQAAVIQAGSIAFDLERSMEKALDFIETAGTQGCELIVFPEAFLSGYPKGADFGTRVGVRSADGRALFRRYYESAIDVPGPETDRIGAASRDRAACVVIGVVERDGGTLYCTALFFDSEGVLRGKHRKVMPTAMERVIWGFGDASTLGVHDLPVGRTGAAICWENYMPLLRAHLYRQNVQLYCAPTVDDRDSWIPSMRHIAIEGRCFVLSACQFSRRADYPADYEAIQGNAPGTVLIRGGSVIVNPFGEILVGPNYSGECILTAELDLNQIVEGKFDLDVAGHYARPDVFRLSLTSET